jgi:NOL1/NOP2/fmu family ribosome biogenesis protein
MKFSSKAKCPECHRVFNLLDEEDADEFYYGHDCEPAKEQEQPMRFDNKYYGD